MGYPSTQIKSTIQVIIAFLENHASRVDSISGFYGITLLDLVRDVTVHLLHSLFSVPFGVYSTTRRIFSCLGVLMEEGPPTNGVNPCGRLRSAELCMRRNASEPQQSPRGIPPACLPCNQAGKLMMDGCDLT